MYHEVAISKNISYVLYLLYIAQRKPIFVVGNMRLLAQLLRFPIQVIFSAGDFSFNLPSFW
jgi:hypothetical protein